MHHISSDSVPLKRPHFEPRDGKLFFLHSTRPFADIDGLDAVLWDLIDGSKTVSMLGSRVADVQKRLQRLWDLGVIEVAPGQFPSGRKRVLVVEPHMDDAVLSVGGLMWALRHHHEFVLATVASRSNFTSYYYSEHEFFEVADVSAIRRAESELVMRLLGGRYLALGETEAPLRCRPGDWPRAWYRAHAKMISEFVMSAAPDREVTAWSASIEESLVSIEPTEIWLPLGVGSHADHELTRNAWLAALYRRPELTAGASVYLYQDVPYANEFPDHTDAIVGALGHAGGRLVARPEDVTSVLANKQRLVSIYGSQFKARHMAPRVREAARRASPSGEGNFELLFLLERLPKAVDRLALYSGGDRVRALASRLAGWYGRHRAASKIRVLSAVPLPRWNDDVESLLRAFPGATLQVHVRQDHIPPGARMESPRVDVRSVLGGRCAWLARLGKCVLAAPVPTLLLTGAGLGTWTFVARAAFPRSEVFSADTMNDVVLSLETMSASDA